MQFDRKTTTLSFIFSLFFLSIFIFIGYMVLVSQYRDTYSKVTIKQDPCDTGAVTFSITKPKISPFIKPTEVTVKIYYIDGEEVFFQERLHNWEPVTLYSPRESQDYRVVIQVKAFWQVIYTVKDQKIEFTGTKNCKEDLKDLLHFF